MTQTTTDYLFQIATPTTDRSFSAGSTSAGDRFDDHLSQASTVSGDDARSVGNSFRPESARHERDDRSWQANDSGSTSHDKDNPTPAKTPPPAQDESANSACTSKPPTDEINDERDTDKSDDVTAAEASGASQTARDQSQKTDSKATPNANSKSAVTAKTAALNEKAVTRAEDLTSANQADRHAAKDAALQDLATQHADEATKVAAATSDLSVATDGTEQTQAAEPESKPSKGDKTSTTTTKAKTDAGATDRVAAVDGQTANSAEGDHVSPEAAQKAKAQAQTNVALATTTGAKGALDSDNSTDDDSHRGSRDDAQAGTRSDGAAQSNKVDAAQLVNAAAPAIDTDSKTTAKTGTNEQSTKPIATKSETPAAAFARLTRTGNGEGNSTAGANDGPRIDPSRFVGRVAKAFQTAQDRGGMLQFRLSPPELGALHLELTVKDGVMSASLQTENAAARRLLLDHLPMLRDRLAEQNIRVDRFDVDVRREGTGGQADTRGSQQQQFQHQSDQPTPRRQTQQQQAAREVAAAAEKITTADVSDAGLNLVV